MFIEYNSDATYNPQYKCAAYSDIHTAADKTNFGGQNLDPYLGLTYMQNSVGYALEIPPTPDTPDGYELEFGPINAADSGMGWLLETFGAPFPPKSPEKQ